MKRNTLIAILYLAIALLVGYFISQQLSDFLGIAINPMVFQYSNFPNGCFPCTFLFTDGYGDNFTMEPWCVSFHDVSIKLAVVKI